MFINVADIVKKNVSNMKPEEAGEILIDVLKQYKRLPKKQRLEVKKLIYDILLEE